MICYGDMKTIFNVPIRSAVQQCAFYNRRLIQQMLYITKKSRAEDVYPLLGCVFVRNVFYSVNIGVER